MASPMLRLLLVLIVAAGAACSGRDAAVPPPVPPTPRDTIARTEPSPAIPAAPPASNTDTVQSIAPPTTPAVQTDSATTATYDRILDAAAAQNVASRSYGEIVQWVGEQLLGRPYVAGLLDQTTDETLVVDLMRFDCVLYIENVLAIARQIALGERGVEGYVANVRALRYRGGAMDGYCSRLHYFTDWIRDNQARGTLRDVTAAIGGEAFDKRIDFMSTHRESYAALASDSVYACIVGTESTLREHALSYLPQDRIAAAYGGMQPGDLVATATSIGGLDVTHTGFVHQTAEHTGFMHASLSSDAVKISPDLQAYVQGVRSQVGVLIIRPVDPRATRRAAE